MHLYSLLTKKAFEMKKGAKRQSGQDELSHSFAVDGGQLHRDLFSHQIGDSESFTFNTHITNMPRIHTRIQTMFQVHNYDCNYYEVVVILQLE